MTSSGIFDGFFGHPGIHTPDNRFDLFFLASILAITGGCILLIAFALGQIWNHNPIGSLALLSLFLYAIALGLWIQTPWEASP